VGIFSGLLLGKSLGIAIFSFLAVKIGVSSLPDDLNWSHVLGAGLLGGIGFTMSIFISLLAFSDSGIVQGAKISVLLSSVVAGTTGYLMLRRTTVHR
jgi:NhaA family Na+:H+ antiporter